MVKGLYWQLYDLKKDPKEMNDLLEESDVVKHLRERYNEFVNTLHH